MAKDFKLIVNDPQQRQRFVDVFGTNIVCIQSFIPEYVALPIGKKVVYMLDLAEISPDQRARLVANIAGRFNLSPAEVDRDLDQVGCPILADGCTLIIENPLRWID